MPIRITPQQFAANTVRFVQNHQANLAKLQTQISTGIRIHKPSDAPGEMGPLLANRATVARIDVDLGNIEFTRSKLNTSVSQLQSAVDHLTRAKSLALDGVQSSDGELPTLAQSVDGILKSMMLIANADIGGKPIYAGTSNLLSPFQVSERNEEGLVEGVDYLGTDERSRTIVGVLATTDAFYSGNEVFMANQITETVFLGDTGAAAGQGIDSGVGNGRLEVRHTATTLLGSSGLQSGVSAADDTLIGDHVLTVDSTQGTLSLDGGNTTVFSPGDTDVRVVASSGAVVHIDTSALSPGFNGDVTVQGSGTLSVDGGVTVVPIDFSTRQSLVDPATGSVTNVDSSGITQAGVEDLEYLGSASVFQVLIDLRNEMLNTRDLSGTEWQEAMARRVGEVERVHEHLLSIVGEQSVDLENLDAIQFRAEDFQLETEQVLAATEAADVTSAIVQMQTEQNALQYTYAVTAQLLSTSLLDFLR